MAFIQLSDISVAFGDRDILGNVTLNLDSKSRTALSGSNGSGKTTLMKVITGEITPDSGKVTYKKGTRTGYLPQDGLIFKGRTLIEEADKAFDFYHNMEIEMEAVASQLQELHREESKTNRLVELHHKLQEKLLAGGYYNRRELTSRVLTGLGFKKEDFSKPCESFSGGWQMRIALAKALLNSPDILLLDEPTNYLDLEARNWLEKFLKDFKGGLLIVSHDRYFLDVTVNEVIELFGGKLKRYKGNYTTYEKMRKAELEILLGLYKKQQEEIAGHEEFINRFRSNASKATQVQSRVKMLEKIVPIEVPETMKKIHFSFPAPPHCGKQVIGIKDLTKAYGNHYIFTEYSTEFFKGEKVVISGVNGAGKTTLLRILAGVDNNYTGEVILGKDVKRGYFSQDINRFKDKNHSILQELEEMAPTHLIPSLRSLLGAFLFRGDDIYKSLSVLSGGEKSRLALLQLLLHPANLLILDEPTNHLDIHSKDILVDVLKKYTGTLIFVSHDRSFIESLATRVIDLTPDGPVDYQGDYSYFMWKKENTENTPGQIDEAELQVSNESPAKGKMDHLQQKQLKNRIRKLKKEEERIFRELEILDKEHIKLENELSKPENYTDGEKARKLNSLVKENTANQEKLSSEWEEIDIEIKRLEDNE